MKQISIDHINQKLENPTAPHQLADKVNRIMEVVPSNRRYPYGYWLKKVKNSNLSWGMIDNICRTAEGLDKKYSKGGYISNQLK